MNIKKYNNKKVKLDDVYGNSYTGVCLYEDADTYEEEQDGLTVKVGYRWFKVFESDIKSVEIVE